ncbi:MAG: MacB family efflux pump subunit [Alphaproteobacteria bacterium]
MNAPLGTAVVELRDVRKTFHRGALAVDVLHGVSLRIDAGEFVAIMGSSGSGKTTLMNILGCLDRPTGGQYLFDGEDVTSFDRDRLADLRSRRFGFVFQQYNLLAHATAVENVEVPAVYAGTAPAARRARATELLERLGLGDRLDHRPSQLSGGQQQRVSIARALMNGGKVILADEPTGALDSRSGREVLDLLKQLNADGHTVIVITHDPAVAAEADRQIRIADGRIVEDRGTRRIASPAAAQERPSRPRPALLLAEIGEAVRMAFRSLHSNVYRTLLTLLGIVIGVGAVIAMLAIGDGAKREVLRSIQAMGTDLLIVRPGGPNVRGTGGVATLVPDDAAEIARLPNVAAVAPEIGGSVTLRLRGRDYQTSATATGPDYAAARDWPTASGVFFTDDDMRTYAPVVVLGRTVVRALMPDGGDPVGEYVLVNNVPFLVVGTMTAKGATSWGTDMDDIAFMPLTTGGLRIFGQRHLRTITVQVADGTRIDETEQAIHALLLARHRTVDFQIRNMAAILDTAAETQNTLTLLLGSIAAISLLVGGIGVMNIMLVTVTERTREIGIRMATGARTVHILLQFLTEALVVCGIGGALGVAGGLGTAWLFEYFGRPIEYSALPVLLAFASAFLTGLLFGFMPARKAARLDPVVALATD